MKMKPQLFTTYPEWDRVLANETKLAAPSSIAHAARMERYFALMARKTNWQEWAKALRQAMALLTGRKLLKSIDHQVVFSLQDNNAFISNLKPVFEVCVQDNVSFIVFAPQKHIARLQAKLPEYSGRIVAIESLAAGSIRHKLKKINITFWRAKRLARQLGEVSALPALWRSAMLTELCSAGFDVGKSPAALIQCNDYWPMEWVLANQMRQLNARSYVLQHGLLGYYHFPFPSDYFLCWTPGDAHYLHQLGTDASRTLVSGSPALENFDSRLREALSQNEEKYFLIIAQPFYNTRPEFADQYFNAIAEMASACEKSERRWKLRLHPADSPARYGKYAANFDSEPLAQSLKNAHKVLLLDSTLYMEAGIAGVPVIQYITNNTAPYLIRIEQPWIRLAQTAEALAAELNYPVDRIATSPINMKGAALRVLQIALATRGAALQT